MRYLSSGPASVGAVGLAAVLLSTVACAPPADPVAAVSVSPARVTLRYSEVRPIDLDFEILAPWRGDLEPRVFVHLYAEPGNILRTFDHPFPTEWVPGERVHRRLWLHQSALGPALRAGRYALSIGLYDASGRRSPLRVDGELEGKEVEEMEYELAEITVSEPTDVPMFRFSEAWKPIEAGQDRQILGRRWLVDEGSIWVTQASEVNSVWMRLQLPAAQAGATRLTLEEGADQPRLRLYSACGEVEGELVGTGTHEALVPVAGAAATETGECEIVFRPNYRLVVNGGVERRAVLLEGLAWSVEPESRIGVAGSPRPAPTPPSSSG